MCWWWLLLLLTIYCVPDAMTIFQMHCIPPSNKTMRDQFHDDLHCKDEGMEEKPMSHYSLPIGDYCLLVVTPVCPAT